MRAPQRKRPARNLLSWSLLSLHLHGRQGSKHKKHKVSHLPSPVQLAKSLERWGSEKGAPVCQLQAQSWPITPEAELGFSKTSLPAWRGSLHTSGGTSSSVKCPGPRPNSTPPARERAPKLRAKKTKVPHFLNLGTRKLYLQSIRSRPVLSWGTWLSQSMEYATLDLRVVGSNPTLSVVITSK